MTDHRERAEVWLNGHSDRYPIGDVPEFLVGALAAEFAAVDAPRVALVARLREIEWGGHGQTIAVAVCPACRQEPMHGHRSDCWLAAAIAEGK